MTCIIALIALDFAVATGIPSDAEYDNAWRMPRTMPTSELMGAIRAIEGPEGRRDTVVFTGASPAWGDGVARGSDTVSSCYADEATGSLRPSRVLNLACNGQLLGDTYFVVRRAAPSARTVFVQLTYHNFNPAVREAKRQRYPELSRMLGVPVSAELAALLRAPETPQPDVAGIVERAIAARWCLFERRDALAREALGSHPEQWLHEYWKRVIAPADWEGDDASPAHTASFDELDPDQQIRIVNDFGSAGDFALSATDSELSVLRLLCEDLEADGGSVVFYLSPVNRVALDSYGLFDEQGYRANVRRIRSVIEAHSMRLIDLNEGTPLPSVAFADMSHTTAYGSELTARRLLSAMHSETRSEGGSQ